MRTSPASQRLRAQAADYGLPILRFLGLFDAVASLFAAKFFNEHMHVLSLPDTLLHASHALAIDENRRPFRPVVFSSAPAQGKLEERWFAGAHANVGGGYPFDPLAIVPLLWMVESARKYAQLGFFPMRQFDVKEALAVGERDSFREFAFGIPALVPLRWLFHRRRIIGREVSGRAEEWIDSSAVMRYIGYPSYQATSCAFRRHLALKKRTKISPGDLDVRA